MDDFEKTVEEIAEEVEEVAEDLNEESVEELEESAGESEEDFEDEEEADEESEDEESDEDYEEAEDYEESDEDSEEESEEEADNNEKAVEEEKKDDNLLSEVKKLLNLPEDADEKAVRENIRKLNGEDDAEKTYAQDLANIKAKYPHVKANHITELGKGFIALMSTGEYDAVKAYETLHPEEKSAAAQQRAINNVKNKSHLTKGVSAAGNRIDIPDAQRKLFKSLNPNVTEREMRDIIKRSRNDDKNP